MLNKQLAQAFVLTFEDSSPEERSPMDIADKAMYLRRQWLAPTRYNHVNETGRKLRAHGVIILTHEGKQIACAFEDHWQEAFDAANTWLSAIVDFGMCAERHILIENTADIGQRNSLLSGLRELPHMDRKIRMKWFFGSEPFARQLRLQAERAAFVPVDVPAEAVAV